MIERLLTIGPIPKPAMRQYVIKEYTLSIFSHVDKQSSRCGGPARRKIFKQNPKTGALRWCGLTDAEQLVYTHEKMKFISPVLYK